MSEPIVCKCPECGAYSRSGDERHGFTPTGRPCPLQSREHLEKQAKQYYDAWLEHEMQSRAQRVRWREQVIIWQGKHALLRHENNKLRRKLTPPTPTQKAEGTPPDEQTH